MLVFHKQRLLTNFYITFFYILSINVSIGLGKFVSRRDDPEIKYNNQFPSDFLFAAATAAYQIEGAWNLSGKGESIWDQLLHKEPEFVIDKSNGDIACDSYHKYREDVSLLKQVGFNVYRFSISWPRILPTGEPNNINQKGINYYKCLIDELLENNIEPMVTLYHWDLPQKLQDMGGWLNPVIADYFEEYARVIFSSLGKQVKWWITINEPTEVVTGYSSSNYAPAVDLSFGVAEYLAAHTLIRAHSKAYRLYQREFKFTQGGKISFAMAGSYCMPRTDSEQDRIAAERWNQFMFGWFGHPIYSTSGGYPPIMRSIIDRRSALEGRTHSRLPLFSDDEIVLIKGSFDFLALNHYTSRICSEGVGNNEPSWINDVNVNVSIDPDWPDSASSWLKVVPKGFRGVLNWISEEYENPPVFITENGFSDKYDVQDTSRIDYHQKYIMEMLNAMNIDNCKVIGYTVWSLLDNFEWARGYTEKFGIYQVNFSDPNRTRTPKASSTFFKELIHERHL